jgi:hypothetical protein
VNAKKSSTDDKKVLTIDATDVDSSKGRLKAIGGSRSDHWNEVFVHQTVQTLWIKHSDNETRDRQYKATVSALLGIGLKDEIEGKIAAQLLAAHNAAMECYRRAMLSEQIAIKALRGKGQQKVTVEDVHVHSGGQAIVGTVDRPTPENSSRSENEHRREVRTRSSMDAYAAEAIVTGSRRRMPWE